MFVSRRSRGALVLCASAAALVAAAPAYAMGEGSPKIKATPHKLMINTTTMLKGKHFPANTTIRLLECGRTSWLAPSNPCLEDNAKEVTTDAKGRFETSFTAGLCPEAEQIKMRTERALLHRRGGLRRRHRRTRRRGEAQGQLPVTPPGGELARAGGSCPGALVASGRPARAAPLGAQAARAGDGPVAQLVRAADS